MYTDYKTTTTYFVVVLTFIYAVCQENVALASTISIPLVIMWAMLKTNSKELVADIAKSMRKKGERNA